LCGGQIHEVMREVMAEVDAKSNLDKVGEAKLKAGNDLALTAKAVTECVALRCVACLHCFLECMMHVGSFILGRVPPPQLHRSLNHQPKPLRLLPSTTAHYDQITKTIVSCVFTR